MDEQFNIGSIDFDCPEGKPWIVIEPRVNLILSSGEKRFIRLDKQFETIVEFYNRLTPETKAKDLWSSFGAILRTTLQNLENHTEQGNCWRTRLKMRIVTMYIQIRSKEGGVGLSYVPFKDPNFENLVRSSGCKKHQLKK